MILAIESCHRYGFIHRDIKPDVSFSGELWTVMINDHLVSRTSYLTQKGILN